MWPGCYTLLAEREPFGIGRIVAAESNTDMMSYFLKQQP